MRIIAGQYRGRIVPSPPSRLTRPILDRAKTVLFDMLGSRLAEPGILPPLAVLDLFCGTGTIGLEALSRGAAYCRFVERHRATAALLRRTLDEFGIIREADVAEADATTCPLTSPPNRDGLPATYGLVFLDPPYRMLEGPAPDRGLVNLLIRLAGSSAVAPDAPIVLRHAESRDRPSVAPLVEAEARVVGDMVLRFLHRPSADTHLEELAI